jgi:hypothetical protein
LFGVLFGHRKTETVAEPGCKEKMAGRGRVRAGVYGHMFSMRRTRGGGDQVESKIECAEHTAISIATHKAKRNVEL